MRVLITGGCGTVGSALAKELIKKKYIVCVYDHSEDSLFKLGQEFKKNNLKNYRLMLGDVRDYDRLNRALVGVDLVFHCAALKHVEISEINPVEAIKTNIEAISNLIISSIEQNVQKVLFTSSDKAVNPSSTMGVTKLMGEKLITSANTQVGNGRTRFATVRFGNILNSNGSVFTIFQKQIKAKKPLTITSKEMTRYFITLGQAVKICLFASKEMVGGEIFVSSMPATDILSLAKAISVNQVSYEIIGLKPGEKLYEELLTEVEIKRSFKYKNENVIIPEFHDLWPEKIRNNINKKYLHLKKLERVMRSDDRSQTMDQKSVNKLVIEALSI